MEFEFTDLDLTAFGGASILAQTARRLGLFELLEEAVSVKVRNRGASDPETLWAIIASLARGHGSLSDLDALRADRVASALLGLRKVPEARRAGEWLARLRPTDVKGLWRAAVEFASRVAPAVIDHEVGTKGYVPLFIDATGIEVDGQLFQWARKDYDGNRGYSLHATFLGGLWSAGQLQPGGGRVTLNWRKLLEWTAGMVPAGTPVWLRADNAYYKGGLVRRHRAKQGQENAFKGPLTDLGLHHPPCRSYRANQAFYALGHIAQALLWAVQVTALPKGARRHGIRQVIRHVMRTAAHMVRTARRTCLRFAKTSFRLDWLHEAMTVLEEARAPPPPAPA